MHRLGATQAAKPRTYQTFKPNNSSGGPDVSFEFIYRNRGKRVDPPSVMCRVTDRCRSRIAVLERDGLIVESSKQRFILLRRDSSS